MECNPVLQVILNKKKFINTDNESTIIATEIMMMVIINSQI